MRLGVALVGHAQIGPADPIASGHESTERVVEARLAPDGHAADAGARRSGFGGRDRSVEGAFVACRELEHPQLIPGAAFGERRGVPQYQRR